MKQIECIITGKVQRVAFRNFIQKHAKALWLAGEVENLRDGSVRVIAQGGKDKLEKLIEYMRKGPFGSRVSNVAVSWTEARNNYSDFSIIY